MNARHLRPQRILVIDDNPVIRELVALALGDYRLSYAIDGERGLAATRQLGPDLVVLDIMMPGIDGFAFLDEVRHDHSLRFLKVLILSAKTLKEDILRGFELGAVDYVTKPFKRDILKAKVDRLVQMRFAEEMAAHERMVWQFLDRALRGPLDLIETRSAAVGESGAGRSNRQESAGEGVAEEVRRIRALVEQGSFLNGLMINPPKPGAVNLGRLLGELASWAADRADRKGDRQLNFDIPADDGSPFLAVGDEKILARAFRNVLTSTLRRTRPDDRIDVRLWQDGADFHIAIADSGPGIPSESQRQAFTPYHVDVSKSPDAANEFGLDLPIAHLIARICGGDLTCTGAEGRTVLTFTLPVSGTMAPSPWTPDGLAVRPGWA